MQAPNKEHMNTLMSLVDDVKDSIPEGKYLEICDTMKKAFENKPSHKRVWKTRVLATHEQPVIYVGNSSSSISDKITITAIKKLPCGFEDDTTAFHPSKHRIQFTHGNDVIHEMAMGGAFHEYLVRVFDLVYPNKIKYTKPVISTDKDNKPTFELTHHTFKLHDWVKGQVKQRKQEKEINKLLDTYDGDDDQDEIENDFRENYMSYFKRCIAARISQDICEFIDTPHVNILN